MKMSIDTRFHPNQSVFSAASEAVHSRLLRRLAPLLGGVVRQELLPTEKAPFDAVRHLSTDRAFRIFTAVAVNPADMYRIGLPVAFGAGFRLVLAAIAVKALLADQLFIPMAVPCAIPKINHIRNPLVERPSRSQGKPRLAIGLPSIPRHLRLSMVFLPWIYNVDR